MVVVPPVVMLTAELAVPPEALMVPELFTVVFPLMPMLTGPDAVPVAPSRVPEVLTVRLPVTASPADAEAVPVAPCRVPDALITTLPVTFNTAPLAEFAPVLFRAKRAWLEPSPMFRFPETVTLSEVELLSSTIKLVAVVVVFSTFRLPFTLKPDVPPPHMVFIAPAPESEAQLKVKWPKVMFNPDVTAQVPVNAKVPITPVVTKLSPEGTVVLGVDNTPPSFTKKLPVTLKVPVFTIPIPMPDVVDANTG